MRYSVKALVLAILALPALSSALPNPASVFCARVGGSEVAITYPGVGQGALCQLGRAQIEEWTLYRAAGLRENQIAVNKFLGNASFAGADMPNPASVNCGNRGGQTVLVNDAQGNAIGLCRFSDGSEIEEWTLFDGPSGSGNTLLTGVLQGTR